MTNFAGDLLHAVRTLARTRAFTAVCVVSLGVGMGIVIAILTFANATMGTPRGIDDTGLAELVVRPQGTLLAKAGNGIVDTWAYPDYLDVRDAAPDIVMTAWSRGDAVVELPDDRGDISPPTMFVSSNYFATVGVAPRFGPGFSSADDASMAKPEAVISDLMWQRYFDSDPGVVGRSVTINQVEHVIVGVAPPSVRGHTNGLDGSRFYLWLPLSRHPRLQGDDNVRLSRDASLVRVFTRLQQGTTVEQADAKIRNVMASLARRYPSTNADKTGGVEAYFPAGASKRAQITTARFIVLGMSGIVLLVVGLNLSGMMLARSAMRERELAVRLAVGASRWRLMRHHFSEALVLAVAGGSLASAVLFGAPILIAWWFGSSADFLEVFRPNAWLALQCVVLCFVTSFVLGFLPALRFSRTDLLGALKNDSKGGGRRAGRLQRLTAAVQAGLAVPFLVMGGAKLDQARVTLLADAGFQPTGLYAARVNLTAAAATDEARRRFVEEVGQQLAQAPSIQSVALGDGLPLDFTYRNVRVTREGESIFLTAHSTRIDEHYLDTVGIALLAGRTISASDREGAERVVLLSEPLARQLYPAGNPIGQRVVFALGGGDAKPYTVVGITGDVVSTQMGNPRPQLFVSLAQHPAPRIMAIARGTPGDPSVRVAYEAALRAANPDYTLGELITGEGLIEGNHYDLLTHALVSGIAALIALVLATLGVYGVIAFMVAMRTREIGVRMALGATRLRVLREVLGSAIVLAVPGIGVGVVLGALWINVLDPAWYSRGGVEPFIYLGAALVAFGVAAVAGLPSARRAASVEPMIAMRAE